MGRSKFDYKASGKSGELVRFFVVICFSGVKMFFGFGLKKVCLFKEKVTVIL
jgi:hypothetical protein